MTDWALKRFWTDVAVDAADNGFVITLDRRPIRTPGRRAFALPTPALAEAAAEEWRAQDATVRPETMPVTRLANSAIDTVRDHHAAVAAQVAAYGETDLLCHRAERPAELVRRQTQGWDPMLGWAAETFGARLRPTVGIMPTAQAPDALARLADAVDRTTEFELAALHELVTLSGSLVLGLAAAHGARSDAELWALSRIDEIWQIEQWGEDAEAAADAETRRTAFLLAGRFCRSAQKPG